jgi:phosphoglycerate dehydrogenase-like enzyme
MAKAAENPAQPYTDEGSPTVRTLFLGHFAASVAPRILAKTEMPLETQILDNEADAAQLAPLLAQAEIVVGHIWPAGFPPAPRLRLLQSVAAGLDLLDTRAVPKGVTICNVFGHEPAIAEYVIMTMLVLTHRLFDAVTSFRAGSWVASPQFGGGTPHREVMGRTLGIVGYGRIGREVAERAAGLKCRVLAANRSSVPDPGPAETVFPLTDLDRMLPLCDTVLIACALTPETKGLIDARRLALMKQGALLINVARAAIVDEDALYAALKDGHLGGASLDVWWQYPTPAEPSRRPSRRPFYELPNVLITPHSSSTTDATAERRWSAVAANLDRFVRGEPLENVVLRT